jgi:hypothetical protein
VKGSIHFKDALSNDCIISDSFESGAHEPKMVPFLFVCVCTKLFYFLPHVCDHTIKSMQNVTSLLCLRSRTASLIYEIVI